MYLNTSSLVLAGAASMDPNAAGRMTGQLVVLIALLAGVLKCWSISRRPTTNTKCALGLMFILVAIFMSSTYSCVSGFLSFPLARVAALAVLGIGLFGGMVAGLVLAIIGLTEIAKRPGVFVQGRAQAIWSLVLTAVFAVFFVFGMVRAIVRVGDYTLAGSSPPGQLLSFDELNFAFRTPERPWVRFDIAKLNKDAKLGFSRRNPFVYFMIIAESVGGDFSQEQLAEIGKANLASAAQSARILNEMPFEMNGLHGLLVETEATAQGQTFFYQHRYFATNGFAYQLIGYGRLTDRQRIAEEVAGLTSRFELIDRRRLAAPAGSGFATNFVSTQYGFWVDVTNSAWRPDASIAGEFPEAEFVAASLDGGAVVAPVWLGAENIDPESLAAGLLGISNIDYPDEKLRNRKEYSSGGVEGVQYDFENEVGKQKYYYRLGILRGPQTAYLVQAWTHRKPAEAELFFADVFRRVHFNPFAGRLLSTERKFTARELKLQASVLNRAALFHYRAGDYEQALRLFRAAVNANCTETYLANALLSWKYLDRPREALDFLEAQPAAPARGTNMRAWQAYFQAEASLEEQALTNYAALFAGGYHDETHLSQYVNLLNGQQRFGEALATIEAALKAEDSIPARLLEAETHRLNGDVAQAIRLLKQQRERAPFNDQVCRALVETCLAAEQYMDALEVSRALAGRNRESASALHLKGRSELGLKWYRDAKNSFEAAAKLAPADKTIRSYLDHVSGLLGEGNNSAVREPIEPVEFPAVWTRSPGAPAPEAAARSYGAYLTRHIVALSWEPGKERRVTEHFQARVLDTSGVAAFSTLQRSFDPLGEELFVNQVRVLDPAGNTISEGKLADYYVLDERSGETASHRKVLNIPVPGLQPGCQLVVTITRRDLGKLEEFPFFEHSFSRSFPICESLVFLRGAGTGLTYRTSPAREPEKLPEGLCWRCLEPLVVRPEPWQPPSPTFAPTLWIADGSARWPGLVTNYLGLIADRLEPDPSASERSRELVAALPTPEAKLRVLTAYVQTNYTYKAIEFGRRARVPNRPAEIIRNRYGDCKDHALLLRQLLVGAGLPAQLALVSFNSAVRQDLPSLDQFDHMIVFVPGEKSLFIDCTDKGSDGICGSPVDLGGCDALILDPAQPRFLSIPNPVETGAGLEVNRRLRLAGNEDIAVKEDLTVKGVQAAYLRNYFQKVPQSSRTIVFQRYLGLEDAELGDFKVEGLEMPGAPLVVRCAYTGKRRFHRSNDRVAGVLRAGIERAYLVPDPVDKRLSPFELRIPLHLSTTVTFESPEGFAVEPPRNADPQLNSRFGRCTSQWQADARTLTCRFEFLRFAGNYRPADYAGYREAVLHALSSLEKEIVFVKRLGR